jgi:predicted ATPase/DNA-binding winged helix-turn-helix (wHTH) protein
VRVVHRPAAQHYPRGDDAVVYEIGPFRLDPQLRTLTRTGAPEPIGPRAVAVLAALVAKAPEPVAKQSIMDAAWPGVVVEESNLSVQIAAIRRVLAAVAGGDRWIETISRRGYRFVGPVAMMRGGTLQEATSVSNVPRSLTSFVGRERELIDLKGLLAKNRLLSIIGPGGIGKTRLAVQLATEIPDAYRDGISFVDFAPLVDPALVASAAAQAIGVHDVQGGRLVATLCRQLEGRLMLLIFDNCEHVLDASAHLADALLRATARLTIIATSREPLRVPGEQIYRPPPLSLPNPAGDLDSIRRSDAVLLFVDRAQHQQHDFALTPERAPAVAELCVRLDGIPLALELAAAHVHSLSIEQINTRLDDRFELLTEGSRTALPRQQTLHATLDWSHGLLSERERRVLRRLAIFAGGFTVEAAAAVANDETIESTDVPDAVAQLVARSLVIADTSVARTRYRLLETTRAYGLEQLDRAGETAAIRSRHAQCVTDLLENAADDWLRQDETQWRSRYVTEIENVRAALEWSLSGAGDRTIAVALAGGSGPVWTTLGLFAQGARWLQLASSQIVPDGSERDAARLWFWLGVASEASPPQALAAFQRAVELYRSLGDSVGQGHAQMRFGRVLAVMGRLDESKAALAEAFPALHAAAIPKLLGFYFTNAAFLKTMTGDIAGARAHYERALTLYREARYEFAERVTLDNLAELNWASGELEAAAAAFRQSIAMRRASRLGREVTLAFALVNLAGVLTELGDVDQALAAAREGLPSLADADRAWVFMDHMGLRAALAGSIDNAARIAGYADHARAAKKSPREPNEARAHARLFALLRERLEDDVLATLMEEGSTMSEHEACAAALER